MVLQHTPGLPAQERGQAGVFHTALVVGDEATPAATLARAARHPRSRDVGSADHLVSRAFYFTDPEGNGIELHWDRPRSAWTDTGGQLEMAFLPLDPRAHLRAHPVSEDPSPAAARAGHVHLRVGDLATARDVHVDALGFAPTLDVPGALLVSAGGYHHHMAMNTWQSPGAGPRAATSGLGEVAITVPPRADLGALADRPQRRSVDVADDGAVLRFEDPWHSRLAVPAAP